MLATQKGMEEVYKLGKKFGLRIVEDAAQAFGSKKRWRNCRNQR